MNSHKSSRENWKHLKTDLYAQNHAIFATESSREKVAKASRQNTQDKNLKNFSKCFSWLEVLPVRELQGKPRKSLSPLTTGPSTREQVARLSREKY